jgi:hypothetical protein
MNDYPELDDLIGLPPLVLHRMYQEAGAALAVLVGMEAFEVDPYASIFDGIERMELNSYRQRLVRALEIAGDR